MFTPLLLSGIQTHNLLIVRRMLLPLGHTTGITLDKVLAANCLIVAHTKLGGTYPGCDGQLWKVQGDRVCAPKLQNPSGGVHQRRFCEHPYMPMVHPGTLGNRA